MILCFLQKLPVMSPTELKSLVTGEGLGANQRPLSSEFEVHLPVSKEREAEEGDHFQLERELCFEMVVMDDQKAKKMADFGLSARTSVLKASGSGREREVLLVECKSGGKKRMMRGGEVLLEVNGTSVAGMSREEVDRALEETADQRIVIKVRGRFKISGLRC